MEKVIKIGTAELLIFILNFTMSVAFDAQNNSYGEMLFQRHTGLELQMSANCNVKNVKRKSFEVPNEMSCCFKCMRESWCYSANFRTSSGINGLYTCEVLSTNKYSSPRVFLKKSKEYVHLSVEALPNKCKITPCMNGGKCVLIDKRQGYRCQCKENYDGDQCQKEGLQTSQILRNHGNNEYVKTLSSYLAPVLKNPSTSRWVRCWHAASDGWDVTKTFHPQCDGKGPTVTIVRVGKYVFGGYSDASWDESPSSYSSSTKAFLFSLYNTKGYQPMKIKLTGLGNQFAILRSRDKGPVFGGGPDLEIANAASYNQNSYSRCSTYHIPPGCQANKECNFYTGSGYFSPSDVEVFYETTS